MTLTPNTQITQENVGLLKAGDWLRGKTHGLNLGELRQFRSVLVGGSEVGAVCYDGAPYGGGTAHCSHFTYIGPALVGGWIEWSGGYCPAPGMRVRVRLRNGNIEDGLSDEFSWEWSPKRLPQGRAVDIIAFRPALSPPAEGEDDDMSDASMVALILRDTLSIGRGTTDGDPVTFIEGIQKAADYISARVPTPTPASVDWNVVGPKQVEAGQALIERWETPAWKDVPATAEYIADLRAALAAAQPQSHGE